MAYYSRRGPMGPVGYSFGGMIPPGVKWLVIVNAALFVLYFLAVQVIRSSTLNFVFTALSLIPDWVIRGAIWQPVTYLFLHSPLSFFHILFNMLTLWMFGSDLERDWGTRRFLNYYFFCGISAGLCDVIARLLLGDGSVPTIGASGAIYGLLLAFGLLYPNRTVYFGMIFPIPARVFVAILGGIAFLSALSGGQSNVAHIAHLGGMLFGYFYLRYRPDSLNIDWMASYRKWQLRRAQRKFEVYMKKRDRQDGGGRWVN